MHNQTYTKKIVVLKIGGSCLSEAESFRQIVARIRAVRNENQGSIVVVLSAFRGLTTMLETIAETCWVMPVKKRKAYAEQQEKVIAVTIRQQYIIPLYSIVGDNKKGEVLATEAEVNRLVQVFFLRFLPQPEERHDVYRARVVAFGEECTVAVVRFVLAHIHNMPCVYIHASKLITTEHREQGYCTDTTIDMDTTLQKVKFYGASIVNTSQPVLVEGFIGENGVGKRTLLEREGSDITAAALARAFVRAGWEVPFVRYYKNVPGVFKHEPSKEEIEEGVGFEERMMLRELLGIVTKSKQKIIHEDAVRLLIGNMMEPRIPAQVALFSTGVVGTKIY